LPEHKRFASPWISNNSVKYPPQPNKNIVAKYNLRAFVVKPVVDLGVETKIRPLHSRQGDGQICIEVVVQEEQDDRADSEAGCAAASCCATSQAFLREQERPLN
jgi:hypothetical protein